MDMLLRKEQETAAAEYKHSKDLAKNDSECDRGQVAVVHRDVARCHKCSKGK